MNTGKAILGILGGLAVGITLGVLFAPEKGADTRKKISKKSGKYKDEMGDKFNDFLDSLTKKFDSLRKEITFIAEDGKGKVKVKDTVV